MKEHFYSYLDGFNKVTVIYPKDQLSQKTAKTFHVLVENTEIELKIKETIDIGSEIKFVCSLPESLELNVGY